MTSLIIDIETLSRQPNAIITEIGAILVARTDAGLVEYDSLLVQPCIATQLAAGRHFEPETIAFHRANRTLPASFTGAPLLDSAIALSSFVQKHKPRTIWIWGKDFDRPILESFASSQSLPLAWEYWRTACARDAWKLAFGEAKPAKRPHQALEDCRATARDLHSALIHLNRIDSL